MNKTFATGPLGTSALALSFVLAGCSAGTIEPEPTAPSAQASGTQAAAATSPPPPPTPLATPETVTESPVYQTALAVWRATREKGECMSCHGADFFDLARTGTSDSDIRRRAIIDGASPQEADDLVAGVHLLREAYRLAPEDPRTFRLMQPGGAVLPGDHAIARDLAFATELQAFAPTLAGPFRVSTLAQAQRARDELLAIDFSTIKIGIPMPLWSADIVHGAQEGVMNDWVADLARPPKLARRAEWLALQDAYLADPSDLNFWRMYYASLDLTEPTSDLRPFDPADTAANQNFMTMKFLSALMGQHVMRAQALGREAEFLRGSTAFAYLAQVEPFKSEFNDKPATGVSGEKTPKFLPNPLWEVGDRARVALRPSEASRGRIGNIGGSDRMVDQLDLLGYPEFVLASIDPTANANQAESDLRLAWFMLGVQLDPGLQRITQSNATRVGEYLQGDLYHQDYFIHRVFQEALRLVNRSYQPDASFGPAPPYNLAFVYFSAYGRHTPTRWNSVGNQGVDQQVKADQIAAYKRIAANFFRMSLLLHEEALDTGRIAPYGATTSNQEAAYPAVLAFFDYADAPQADYDLVTRVAAKAGYPLPPS